MTAQDWLQSATAQLQQSGSTSARLDAELLLAYYAQKPREYLLAHSEIVVTKQKELDVGLARRLKHEPLAYILGHKEFYTREFVVTPDVLVPRPETETMIKLLKQLYAEAHYSSDSHPTIIDVGTGSGCLAVTSKLELPSCKVIATDCSDSALEVARQNALALHADVSFLQGNLLEALPETQSSFIILANLPYVPDDYAINNEAQNEPGKALFGGPDGLGLYRVLFGQAKELANKPAFIFTETLDFQHASLAIIAKENGFTLKVAESLIQVFS
jgi:release factor glutamine methyltransferase